MAGPKTRLPIIEVFRTEAHIESVAEIKRLISERYAQKPDEIPNPVEDLEKAMAILKEVAGGSEKMAESVKRAAKRNEKDLSPLEKIGILSAPTNPNEIATGKLVYRVVQRVLAKSNLEGLEKGPVPSLKLGRLRMPLDTVARLAVEVFAQKRYKVPDPARPGSIKERTDQRAGVLFEMLMPFFGEVVALVTEVAIDVARDILKERSGGDVPARKLSAVAGAIRRRMAAVGTPLLERIVVDGGRAEISIAEDGPIGEGLRMLALTRTRTVDGKEVADHIRVIISDTPTVIDLWQVAVGESKFESGTSALVAQIIETVDRIGLGLRAGNLKASVPVKVRWGSRVVAIIQSEVQLRETPKAGLVSAIREAAKAPNLAPEPLLMTNKKEADAARQVIRVLVEASLALWED